MEAVWVRSAPVTVAFPPRSEPHEPAQRELTALDREIEKQTVQLREWQMQELLKLRQQLHTLERELQLSHQQEVSTSSHSWVGAPSWTPPPISPPPPVCCRPSRS